MKKKSTKHFVPNKGHYGTGTPACNCFQEPGWPNLSALDDEIAKGRRDTNCKRCRNTKIFRKIK